MALTERGSGRIGLQDYIELRANGVTVRMRNGADYAAENHERVLRRKHINKQESYRRMYRAIGRGIANNAVGDSIDSVRVSTGAVLALERQLTQTLHSHKSEPIPFRKTRTAL